MSDRKLVNQCARCEWPAVARLTHGSKQLLCFTCLTAAINAGELEEENGEDDDDFDDEAGESDYNS